MGQTPRFTLRTLAQLVTLICVILAIMRALEPEWRFVLAVAVVTCAISWACLATSGRAVRSVRWCMLIAISSASAGLLWCGLHPALYYMAGFFLAIMLWGGVLTSCLIVAVTSLAFPGSAAIGVKTIEERALLIIPLVTTLLLTFQVPLRLGAATAIPALAGMVNQQDAGRSMEVRRCGLYAVKLPARRKGHTPEQAYFVLANDADSAFVYSPSGIDDIAYNAGSKGHLFGDWYWITED